MVAMACASRVVGGTGPSALGVMVALIACCSLPVAKAVHPSSFSAAPINIAFVASTPTAIPYPTRTTARRVSPAAGSAASTQTRRSVRMRSSSCRATDRMRRTPSFLIRPATRSSIGSSIGSPIGSSTGSSSESSIGFPIKSSITNSESDSIVGSAGKSGGVVVESGMNGEAGGATVSREERRRAAKSALLSAFGEEIDGSRSSEDGNSALASAGLTNGRTAVDPVLACPSTLGDLTTGFRSYGGALSVSYKSSKKLPGTKYPFVGESYTDFVNTVKPPWRLSREESVKEGTFQNPLVPWLYERGWRQGFNANGFPGIDEEFRQVEEFFLGAGSEGGTVVDLSCGSGLMMRRLVASKKYSRVIGGDLSPAMLAETAQRFTKAGLGTPELIRCDVSKLPLKSESLDGVHAGAALHCWSKLEDSLSEVFRVLKPGKGFFATTFLTSSRLARSSGDDGFKFFEVDELEQLMLNAGFADVKVVQNGNACAIVRALKDTQ